MLMCWATRLATIRSVCPWPLKESCAFCGFLKILIRTLISTCFGLWSILLQPSHGTMGTAPPTDAENASNTCSQNSLSPLGALEGLGPSCSSVFWSPPVPWSPSLPGAAASSAFIHSGCSLTSHNGPAFPPLSDGAEISSSHQWNESWVSSLSFLFVHVGIGSFWKLHTSFFGRACERVFVFPIA